MPTPQHLSYATIDKPRSISSKSLPDQLLLRNIDCTTDEDFVQWSRVPELVSLEMVFHLRCKQNEVDISGIMNEMYRAKVSLPKTFDMNDLLEMSKNLVNAAYQNINAAPTKLVKCLHGNFVPSDSQLLHEWRANSKRYSDGVRLEANNFELNPGNRTQTISLSAIFILRHIMYSHKLSLPNVLTLWASFYALVMRRPLDLDLFTSQSALWNNIQRLHYIDNIIATD